MNGIVSSKRAKELEGRTNELANLPQTAADRRTSEQRSLSVSGVLGELLS
jgi:hypothetical protein